MHSVNSYWRTREDKASFSPLRNPHSYHKQIVHHFDIVILVDPSVCYKLDFDGSAGYIHFLPVDFGQIQTLSQQ